jgi:hypothetical protein
MHPNSRIPVLAPDKTQLMLTGYCQTEKRWSFQPQVKD